MISDQHPRITYCQDGPFKSDDEAIEWIMEQFQSVFGERKNWKTIAKAIALCCGAKRGA